MPETWETLYEDAIKEVDRDKMPERIQAACDAIDSRLMDRPPAEECNRLIKAAERLVALGREAADWPQK